MMPLVLPLLFWKDILNEFSERKRLIDSNLTDGLDIYNQVLCSLVLSILEDDVMLGFASKFCGLIPSS